MVKTLPSNAGDMGSIPGWGTKIPNAAGQLSPHTATTEPMHSGARAPQLERKACVLQQKIPRAASQTRRSQKQK